MEEPKPIQPWLTVGWEISELEGVRLMALSLRYRSNSKEPGPIHQSRHYVLDAPLLRELSAAMALAADGLESGGLPPLGAPKH